MDQTLLCMCVYMCEESNTVFYRDNKTVSLGRWVDMWLGKLQWTGQLRHCWGIQKRSYFSSAISAISVVRSMKGITLPWQLLCFHGDQIPLLTEAGPHQLILGCLMMSLRIPLLLLNLITLFTALGASGTEWRVKYNKMQICALNGSKVFINGTFTYPKEYKVTNTFWVIDSVKEVESPDLYNRKEFSGRIQYLGDKQQSFSLRLSNVTKYDEHMYSFRVYVKSQVKKDKYLYYPGVLLKITELHVETTQAVKEGDTTDLTCTTSCNLTDPSFIWYKNGQKLKSSTNPLHLQLVSSEDAGSYRCAVRGYEHLPSPVKNLTVKYPPKKVSITLSGEIMEGSSVTLTCSSDANPPVQNYTWFKEGGTSPVASGWNYTITNITAEHTGLYDCVAQNEYGSLNGTVTITINRTVTITIIGTGTITIKRGQRLFSVWIGVGGGAFLLVTVIIWISRKKNYLSENESDRTSQDDIHYDTVTFTRSRPVQDNVHCEGVTITDQQEEPQYASVTLQSYFYHQLRKCVGRHTVGLDTPAHFQP